MKIVIPATVILLQIVSFIHLYYITNNNEHAHLPVTFIELVALSIVNLLFLFLVFVFTYREVVKVTSIWKLAIMLSFVTFGVSMCFYVL